jgi:adenine-specific DNA-methyltransferase
MLNLLEKPDASTPEDIFVRSTDRTARKKLGQFFTPAPIAALMADWVMTNQPALVLDPAVGPGALLKACAERDQQAQLAGYDVDTLALSLAETRLGTSFHGQEQDFLTAELKNDVDAIICNPPYVRHHDFEIADEIRHKIELDAAKKTSKLSNIYLYFILKACSHLALGGRAAFLVPTEWSNANFGSALKEFFAATGLLKQVVYFSGESLVFEDNLSTGCLLLIENDIGRNHQVKTYYVPSGTMPENLEQLYSCAKTKQSSFALATLAASKKWDHLIANGEATDIPGGVRLGELAKTKRGIATGDNSYFLMSRADAVNRGIPATDTKRCISKAAQVKTEVFSEEHAQNLEREAKVFLFDPVLPLAEGSRAYVHAGEVAKVNERYLTKMRRPWHAAETRTAAPIWAAVFGRGQLRFCYNEAKFQSLTTFHGIYPKNSSALFARALTACLNSEPVQTGMQRQHRVYGGGLLKVEPRDLLDVIVPNLDLVSAETLSALAETLISKSDEARTKLVEKAFLEAAAKPDRLF